MLIYDQTNGADISLVQSQEETAGDWSTLVTISGTAPATCSVIRIYLQQMATAGAATTMFFDTVTLTEYLPTGGTLRLIPMHEYDYMFALPSDWLRVFKAVEPVSNQYEIENGYVLTDNNTLQLRYISLVTSVTKYPKAFTEALATKLAAELALSLAGKHELKANLLKELYTVILPEAKRINAIEAIPKTRYKFPSEDLTSWQKAGR